MVRFSATETRLEVSVHTPSFVAVLNAKQLADRCAFEHSENSQTVNACELPATLAAPSALTLANPLRGPAAYTNPDCSVRETKRRHLSDRALAAAKAGHLGETPGGLIRPLPVHKR